MTTTTVIHHSADFDGLFCREIAKKFLPDANLIGWDFGDPPVPVPTEGTIYVMDLPVDRVFDIRCDRYHLDIQRDRYHPFLERTVWIDHHKSSIDSHSDSIPGYRIDGVAACRLAWQWFSRRQQPENMPIRESFIGRGVEEPIAVRLAGEYDVWDKRDPDAELFQHGLRSEHLTGEHWNTLLGFNGALLVEKLLYQGACLQYAKTQENASIISKNGFTVQWEGLKFLACNAAQYNSHLFTAAIKPEHDALLGFCLRSNGKWSVSLYGVPGSDLDLSAIAKKYGGGGHKQACGFTCDKLPFLT